jgi:hypothetical protein
VSVRVKAEIRIKGIEDYWIEEFNCPANSDYMSHVEGIIAEFNSSLRPHEAPRELLRILSETVDLHSWGKVNLVTESYKGKCYDRYQCRVCRITAKRFGLAAIFVRDSGFKAKKYEFCSKPKSLKHKEKQS